MTDATPGRSPPGGKVEGREDGAPRRAWFGQITMLLNAIGTVLIIVMALAVNADIFGRELFNRPIAGVTEFVGLSIVAVVFLQMANTLREGRHVSNDLILALVGRRHPHVARFCHGIFHVIGALLMALIGWYVWPIFIENYEGGYYKGTTGVVEIPVWPFMLVVLVGAAATVVQYLLLAWHEFAAALRRA
ncbi:MAG: TRAP transporter small permease [Rhodospirillaceae bacterium]|nr:TRAP transporter small permease [Rhodospirillaceae bacterium]